MDFQVGNIRFLWLLGAVGCGGLLTLVATVARRRARKRFASAKLVDRMIPDSAAGTRTASAMLVAAALSLLSLALLDIRWGKTAREVPQKGLEVVFALDVSRSMLAEDTSPTRLERAKQQIGDLLDEMTGDRVALVLFAGESRLQVPLTSHYDDFRQSLESAGPESLNRGGSRLGEALETAAGAFLEKTGSHRTILLFTDGEDQESGPAEIARRLHAEKGIRIFTVGLGDIDRGSRIPDTGDGRGFVEYRGEPVWSRLNGKVLGEIAAASGAAFVPAGTRQVDMARVYHQFIANVPKASFENATIDAWTPRFQWFALPALALLLVETVLVTRLPRPQTGRPTEMPAAVSHAGPPNRKAFRRSRFPVRASAALLAIAVPALAWNPVAAAQPQDSGSPAVAGPAVAGRINAANQLVRAGEIQSALQAYAAISPAPALQSRLDFNRGVALYRNGDLAAAEELFRTASAGPDGRIAGDASYNLGNCQFHLALQASQPGSQALDPQPAIDRLRQAIASYRKSIELGAADSDARANIELAGEQIAKLEELRKQQDESRENQQQQPPSDGEQNQDPENQPAGQNENSGGQDSPPQKPEGQPGPQEENAPPDQTQSPEQQDPKGQGQDRKPPRGEGQPGEPQAGGENPAAEKPPAAGGEETGDPQPQGKEDPRSGGGVSSTAPPPSAENRPRSRGSSHRESSSADSAPEVGQEPPLHGPGTDPRGDPRGELQPAGQNQSLSPPQQPGEDHGDDLRRPMTREEAMKMLQSIRDRDLLRRLRQQERDRLRQSPVEKDW